jgi:hypothetical protein
VNERKPSRMQNVCVAVRPSLPTDSILPSSCNQQTHNHSMQECNRTDITSAATCTAATQKKQTNSTVSSIMRVSPISRCSTLGSRALYKLGPWPRHCIHRARDDEHRKGHNKWWHGTRPTHRTRSTRRTRGPLTGLGPLIAQVLIHDRALEVVGRQGLSRRGQDDANDAQTTMHDFFVAGLPTGDTNDQSALSGWGQLYRPSSCSEGL